MTAVTDKYFKALEPKRKLKTPTLPAQVTQQLDSLSQNIGAGGADLKVQQQLLDAWPGSLLYTVHRAGRITTVWP